MNNIVSQLLYKCFVKTYRKNFKHENNFYIKMEEIDKIVPDTSVIIEGMLSEKIINKEIKVNKIIIHDALCSELEHQANDNRMIGLVGLDELNLLKDISKKNNFELEFKGRFPTHTEIRFAKLGEIDALIRELAYDEDAVLYTSDKIQHKVATAKGIKTIYLQPKTKINKLKIEKYFTDKTMSVHLTEKVTPYAKIGMPGNWEFVRLSEKPLEQREVQEMAKEIIEEAKKREDGFIEISRPGSTIVQLGKYRTVICEPPFSDNWEITLVRPVKQLRLSDYELSEKLFTRLTVQAEGVLVAGSPGMGKSTFVQALGEYYSENKKIVKTVEAPRDLVLPDSVTQYSLTFGTQQEIHDVLLLTRPDYTLFDEMRNTQDFMLFSDLRLAGVGMVGVVHATNPIDAIQRFIGRVEMGVIPQIIDTVIFIKDGKINKVLELEMTVKVPAGMTESDLSRPIVVVKDFETKTSEFEIYSYGEQTVVVPVAKKDENKKAVDKLAITQIKNYFRRYSEEAKVEILSDNKCVVFVPEEEIGRIIGKQGKNIEKIEKDLELSIDIKPIESEEKNKLSVSVPFDWKVANKNITFFLPEESINKDVDLTIDNEYILSAKVSLNSTIKIRKDGKVGKEILDALNNKKKVEINLS